MNTTAVRSALKARGLRKSFGDKIVLDGIDLEIAEGTTFSLLGPNGAGKTTTVQILSTLTMSAPGSILMTSTASGSMTAVGICTDMNEGIIARFRTMAITRTSVLTGKVIGSLIRTLMWKDRRAALVASGDLPDQRRGGRS
jgi:ABC-type branched-subunit amino acid transport system ATPase component